MISRNLSRRIDRLEELTMPSGVQHVITVTYVNPDGSPDGEGYRIEIPSHGPPVRFGKRMTPPDDK
jgi:hypothetical protein